MTVVGRVFAVVAVALAVVALVAGQTLVATSMLATATGVLVSTTTAARREAERRAAFAQRLRAARREPQGVVVVRRCPERFPARLMASWVDIDGEARGWLSSGRDDAYPVAAGERTVVVRRPWSAGRPVRVVVPAGGSSTVEV